MNRVIEQRWTLESDEAKELFVGELVKFAAKRPLVVYHWCVMSNHFHLAVEVMDVRDLTYVVAHACRCFSMAYHRRHGGSGYLWQGRFKSILVQKDGYLGRLGRYIERNPLVAGNEGVVEPADYRWSSARAYARGDCDPLVSVELHPQWKCMGKTDADRRVCYRRHLHTAKERAEEDQRLFEDSGTVVGDDDFCRQARSILGRPSSRSRGRPRKAPHERV
jgi:putative transposase